MCANFQATIELEVSKFLRTAWRNLRAANGLIFKSTHVSPHRQCTQSRGFTTHLWVGFIPAEPEDMDVPERQKRRRGSATNMPRFCYSASCGTFRGRSSGGVHMKGEVFHILSCVYAEHTSTLSADRRPSPTKSDALPRIRTPERRKRRTSSPSAVSHKTILCLQPANSLPTDSTTADRMGSRGTFSSRLISLTSLSNLASGRLVGRTTRKKTKAHLASIVRGADTYLVP